MTTVSLAAAAVSSPAAATPGAATINWSPCPGRFGSVYHAQCGMLDVPLDYANPGGATIQLAVSRILHTSPDSDYQGVMLTNPGGPGGSGLTLSVLKYYVPNGGGDSYDWIGFDPRGVGSSVPSISCDPNYFSWNRPNYIPVRTEDLTAWNNRSKGYAQACASNGPILRHLTTMDSVKDMDSIRAALGASHINYFGFSYGTYLGQIYATTYPNNVRRMVLDSNVDPRRIWYKANLAQDLAFNRNIKIWFGWLAQHNSTYHLGATESAVESLFYKTQSKLTFTPADGKVGGDEWVDAFLYAGYYQSTWPGLADVFSGYINNGDVASLEQAYADAQGMGDDNGFAVYNGVQCTDIQYPTDKQKVLDDNWAIYRQAPYETWSNNWYNAPCQYWPAPAHATWPMAVSSNASALLIDETLDAATPYSGSLYVRSVLPNSRLLALPGGTSHANSLYGNACEDDMIAAYLADGTLPPRLPGSGPDAKCKPLPRPVPGAGAAAATASNPFSRQSLQLLIGGRP